jgi:alpha-D-ribose 1-methylphosphonate 5-triphosphate synthase subunit PhnL
VLEVRRTTLGYVSQFLRVIPRVSTLDIVSEPLRRQGVDGQQARQRAAQLLARLNIPENLWPLAPSTFSGGEQQRVNIAHCFVTDYPLILLDEPTASLDAENRQVVVDLMHEAMQRGAALVGIFHDAEVRKAVGTHSYDMSSNQFRSMAA